MYVIKYALQTSLGVLIEVWSDTGNWVVATNSAMKFKTLMEAQRYYMMEYKGPIKGTSVFIEGPRGGIHSVVPKNRNSWNYSNA